MRQFFAKKYNLSLPWRIAAYFALSLGILLVCVALQAGPLRKTLMNFLHAPLLLLLNWFPILAVLGLLWALIGNLLWAGSLSALLFELLSLINLIKIECRKDPLVPPDFALLGEAMVATGEYQLDLHLPYLAFILLSAVGLFLLGLKLKARPRPAARILGGLLAAGLFAAAMVTVYPSADVYGEMVRSVEGLSSSNVPAVFDETGFLYCFLHNYGLYDVQKPEAYDRDTAAGWASGGGTASDPLPVDVVMVQCEAFSDLYDAEIFDFAPEENPLYLFHRVAASDQAVSGRIVVSNFGAGTANTEFDVLTGIQTNMLNENSTSALRVIHKEMASICRVYSSLGYGNWFMHPGKSWFYNRESSYQHMGFTNLTFEDEFLGKYGWKGAYISDKSFGQMLVKQYAEAKAASDAPWFAFTVTIQNHQAYHWTKYADRPEEVPLKRAVSDEALESLSVYAEGIRDSAKLLYDLTVFFDQQESPMLLIFWGDHLPTLGKNYAYYQEIGLDIGDESSLSSALDTYSTPFVIWANRAYCEQYDFAARAGALELPVGDRISDTYLGELVYELCGLEGLDPYLDYLGQARRILPVISLGRYVLPDGSLTDTLTAEQQAVVEKLRCWGYYRVIDERIG